jgi:hypothetical protein
MSRRSGCITCKQAMTQIRAALKHRSIKKWSVTTSRGTSYGWIRVCAPPSRQVSPSQMSQLDQLELAVLFGMDAAQVGSQGIAIPSTEDAYHEYIDRAEGREPLIKYEIDHYSS